VLAITRTVLPGTRTGLIRIPASKSQAHRLLICAALGHTPVTIPCDGLSRDITATMECLNGLGASIRESSSGILEVTPIANKDSLCQLFCGESGSTLRFLLPVIGALNREVTFHMEGRLPQRPLAPLDELLCLHGMHIRQEADLLHAGGTLCAGDFSIPGNISSQYISGLLLALPLLNGDSRLTVTGTVESQAYITMTEDALRMAGIRFEKSENTYHIPGNQSYQLPRNCPVEGDYSNAAFFLCSGALSREGITVKGLSPHSAQGDRQILEILQRFGAQVIENEDGVTVKHGALHGIEIDAAPIPDLIPVLSVVAAGADGTTYIQNAGRLRLKESDRLASTTQMLTTLGAEIHELADALIIHGKPYLQGGTVSSWNDHRIAMSAAVAAGLCREPVVIEDSQCTEKSYPRFWEDLEGLKGEDSL